MAPRSPRPCRRHLGTHAARNWVRAIVTEPHLVTDPMSTEDAAYAYRLARLETVWWKRWLDVQRPYRWNLRRLEPGFTLDIGCGLGRNLSHLGGDGVGIDHNEESVATARARGL